MRRENAPADFIEAWDALQDDGLADEARRIIEDEAFDVRADAKTMAVIFGFLIFAVVLVLAAALYLKE